MWILSICTSNAPLVPDVVADEVKLDQIQNFAFPSNVHLGHNETKIAEFRAHGNEVDAQAIETTFLEPQMHMFTLTVASGEYLHGHCFKFMLRLPDNIVSSMRWQIGAEMIEGEDIIELPTKFYQPIAIVVLTWLPFHSTFQNAIRELLVLPDQEQQLDSEGILTWAKTTLAIFLSV